MTSIATDAQEPARTTWPTPPLTLGGRDSVNDADFVQFVTVAMPELLRYGYRLTGNPHDASDLVQAVLERVGARWGVLRERAVDPHGYIRRAMANAHVSRWRRLRRERLVAEVPDHPAPPQPDPVEGQPLWQALQALPARQRAVLVLRYYDGLSEAEIADALRVRPGTVKSQAAKALASLRSRLGSDDLPAEPSPSTVGHNASARAS